MEKKKKKIPKISLIAKKKNPKKTIKSNLNSCKTNLIAITKERPTIKRKTRRNKPKTQKRMKKITKSKLRADRQNSLKRNLMMKKITNLNQQRKMPKNNQNSFKISLIAKKRRRSLLIKKKPKKNNQNSFKINLIVRRKKKNL